MFSTIVLSTAFTVSIGPLGADLRVPLVFRFVAPLAFVEPVAAFLGADFFAVDFAADFFGADLVAAPFLAGAFLAEGFFAVAPFFAAAPFFVAIAVDFFVAVTLLRGDAPFFAAGFLAAVDLAADFLVAAGFFAAGFFLAAAGFDAADFFVGFRAELAFFALLADFFVVEDFFPSGIIDSRPPVRSNVVEGDDDQVSKFLAHVVQMFSENSPQGDAKRKARCSQSRSTRLSTNVLDKLTKLMHAHEFVNQTAGKLDKIESGTLICQPNCRKT